MIMYYNSNKLQLPANLLLSLVKKSLLFVVCSVKRKYNVKISRGQ